MKYSIVSRLKFLLCIASFLLVGVNHSFSKNYGTFKNIKHSDYYYLQNALESLLLTNWYNSFVYREFSKLYKEIYGLSYSKIPFRSFEMNKFDNNRVPLIQHSHMYCACSYHNPVSMVSADGKCILYLHVLSQFDSVNTDSIDEYYVKRFLARKVKCNIESDKPTSSSISDREVSILSVQYLDSYTNYKWVKISGADVVFTAKFPNRETIGAYMNDGYVQLHPEYGLFYTVFFYKQGHLPIQILLFLDANAVLEDYLIQISRSIRF